MSHFSRLISIWNELMGGEHDPDPSGLQFVHDEHVLELTAGYISNLQAIQQEQNNASADFESRVRARVSDDSVDLQYLEDMCRRFLAGIELTLLEEIPDSIPVSETNKLKTLEIDWTADPVSARWVEVGVQFPLLPALAFCAEHSAGAGPEISEVLVEQLVSDLQQGIATVGLALQSHDSSKSVFYWSPAFVSVDDPSSAAAAPAAESDYIESAFETYLQDWQNTLTAKIHECATERRQSVQQANVETLLEFDDMPEPDANDPIHEKLRLVLDNFAPARKRRAIQAMASSAMTALVAAQAMGIVTLIEQRGRVLKSIKKVKKTQTQEEFETA